MTQQQFLDSLTPEQSSAFIAIRDAIMASNAVAMKELGDMLAAANATAATHTAERDALADIIARAKQCHSSGDHAALEAMFIEAAKSDEQKALEAAEAKVAETARAAAEAERELESLKAAGN